eukprot:TRINITY_DN12100_c0_g1_i2.p1 TRINITY_DN12100_c0_g1~~TRINITY_DN12100_c0_g1_i2.p1  ORF type:complete len:433 (+),score=44.53 TRINITY_DN12100_c0_g1_i2:368-1666(+)
MGVDILKYLYDCCCVTGGFFIVLLFVVCCYLPLTRSDNRTHRMLRHSIITMTKWSNLRVIKRVVELSDKHKNDGAACALLKERIPKAFADTTKYQEEDRLRAIGQLPTEIEKLIKEGYSIGEMTLSSAIAQCKRACRPGQGAGLKQALLIMEKAKSLGIPHNTPRIQTAVVSVASSVGNIELLQKTMKDVGIDLSKPSIFNVNDLLKVYSICEAPWEDVQDIWKQVEKLKLEPTIVVFHALMKCAKTLRQMTWVFDTLKKYKFEPDTRIMGAAIRVAGIAKRFDVAGMIYNNCLSNNHIHPDIYVRISLLLAAFSCGGIDGIDFAISEIEKNFEMVPSTLQLIVAYHPSVSTAEAFFQKYTKLADSKVRQTLKSRVPIEPNIVFTVKSVRKRNQRQQPSSNRNNNKPGNTHAKKPQPPNSMELLLSLSSPND